jgi:hypothetical protein
MIKAIETRYKGYRFRSRLEARWAVFFDALGIKWEYEKEGYDLGAAGWYLPDFWLPHGGICPQGLWVEVKANKQIGGREIQKCDALSIGTGRPVLMCIGMVEEERLWQFSPKSLTLGLELINGDTLYTYQKRVIDLTENNKLAWSCRVHASQDRIEQAYTAARAARFEHGEKPA